MSYKCEGEMWIKLPKYLADKYTNREDATVWNVESLIIKDLDELYRKKHRHFHDIEEFYRD
jgi:hypothetical protein